MSGQYELTAEEKRRALESARALKSRLAGDVTREPTGGQGLREAVGRAVWRTTSGRIDPWSTADAILALPELAALIADAERVRRVRTLATSIRETPGMGPLAGALFQILDGDQ